MEIFFLYLEISFLFNIFSLVFSDERCFRCLDRSKIIPSGQLCDGIIHCDDLSDECLCLNQNESLQVICRAVASGKCLHIYFLNCPEMELIYRIEFLWTYSNQIWCKGIIAKVKATILFQENAGNCRRPNGWTESINSNSASKCLHLLALTVRIFFFFTAEGNNRQGSDPTSRCLSKTTICNGRYLVI